MSVVDSILDGVKALKLLGVLRSINKEVKDVYCYKGSNLGPLLC
jgi:hypothetical protein